MCGSDKNSWKSLIWFHFRRLLFYMKKKLLVFLFFFINACCWGGTQTTIHTRLIHNYQESFEFSVGGKYLTTNISLFEENKLNLISNEPGTGSGLEKSKYRSNQLGEVGYRQSDSCRKKVKANLAVCSKPGQTSPAAKTLQETDKLRKRAEVRVGEFLKKRYCIDNNLISSYSKEVTTIYMARFSPKTEELGKRTEVLNGLVKEGPQTKDREGLIAYQKKLTILMEDLDTGFNEICEADKTLCGCYAG